MQKFIKKTQGLEQQHNIKIIPSQEIDDITRKVKSLEDFSELLTGASQTIEDEIFPLNFMLLLRTLGTILLGNALAGKEVA